MTMPLIIAGITLPTLSSILVNQTWSEVDGGSTMRRRANGSAFTMRRWRKRATTISATGWSCVPLLGVDLKQPFELRCVTPIALGETEPLPAGWTERTDAPSVLVTDPHNSVKTRLVYPVLTVVAPAGIQFVPGADTSWTLQCEEV